MTGGGLVVRQMTFIRPLWLPAADVRLGVSQHASLFTVIPQSYNRENGEDHGNEEAVKRMATPMTVMSGSSSPPQ